MAAATADEKLGVGADEAGNDSRVIANGIGVNNVDLHFVDAERGRLLDELGEPTSAPSAP